MMRIRCNNCGSEFDEDRIVHDESDPYYCSINETEFCPVCGKGGCLMDLGDPDNPGDTDVVSALKHAYGKAQQLVGSLDFVIWNRPTKGDIKDLSNLNAEVGAYLGKAEQKLQEDKE